MKIYRPLWSEGVFLTPEQFQQQARWEAFANAQIAQLGLAYPWGIETVELNSDMLKLGHLTAERLSVRFQDGSWINTEVSDILPPSRDLNRDVKASQNSIVVYLGLPIVQANGNNCFTEKNSVARPQRYRQEWIEVQDLYGTNQESIAVERYALSLLYDFEDMSDYIVCPIALLQRDNQGLFQQENSYLPPMLNINNKILQTELLQLCTQIQAKRSHLMNQRRESSQQMADFALADISLFWLLNALNSHGLSLDFFKQHPTLHPEQLYQKLVTLTGSLLTFSLEYSVEDIPAYQHENLEQVLPPLFLLLGKLLDKTLPSRMLVIDLIHDNNTRWVGALHDSRITENADFYVSVRSTIPMHQIIEQFPKLCKVGATDEINQLIHSALSGVPLKALHQVPAAIPVKLGNHYFSLDMSHTSAQNIMKTRSCEFYVPKSLSNISLEFYVVLKS